MNTGKYLFIVVLSLLVVSCGNDNSCKRNGLAALKENNSAKPYSKKPHANLSCALATDEDATPCQLVCLPLIGNDTRKPDKQDIESRLLVSHSWMGDRFMRLLDEMPDDILLLLRSVTAIVIDSDIRPSFYTTQTGAIYLDPVSLWLTQEEKDTISGAADYRSGYDDSLAFASLWRYLREDGSLAMSNSGKRELEDLIFPLARLLYHELAHANTFFPPASHEKVDNRLTVIQAINKLEQENGAQLLNRQFPLQSQRMKDLAFVMFRGEVPTKKQSRLTALQVGNAMAGDRANDDYAYVPFDDEVYYEDIAMLFEELMAKYHFNIDREIAYTNAAKSAYCNDYLIAWGQTGRIGDHHVKQAAKVAVNYVLPEANMDDFIDDLAAPIQTPVRDWCAPLVVKAGKGILLENVVNYDVRENMRSPHHH